MPAIVAPRNTSSATRRSAGGGVGATVDVTSTASGASTTVDIAHRLSVTSLLWSAAACRRFGTGSLLPAAAASRGRKALPKAPHSERTALQAVTSRRYI